MTSLASASASASRPYDELARADADADAAQDAERRGPSGRKKPPHFPFLMPAGLSDSSRKSKPIELLDEKRCVDQDSCVNGQFGRWPSPSSPPAPHIWTESRRAAPIASNGSVRRSTRLFNDQKNKESRLRVRTIRANVACLSCHPDGDRDYRERKRKRNPCARGPTPPPPPPPPGPSDPIRNAMPQPDPIEWTVLFLTQQNWQLSRAENWTAPKTTGMMTRTPFPILAFPLCSRKTLNSVQHYLQFFRVEHRLTTGASQLFAFGRRRDDCRLLLLLRSPHPCFRTRIRLTT